MQSVLSTTAVTATFQESSTPTAQALQTKSLQCLRSLSRVLWPLLLVALSACGSLPRVDQAAKHLDAIPLSSNTALGRVASSHITDNNRSVPDQSGFRLMPLGSFSLDTRVQLARRAQVSLDVQYYHIENDESGRLLLRELRNAAARGVRVRLLIDDFYTADAEELFLSLAAHPNVEVRLFNPFCCARGQGPLLRFAASIGDFKRVNHRMHNKLFLADGAMAVIGGRNVANEYFLRNSMGQNFIDVDAFVIGWVIAPLQNLFDRYWNALAVYPLEALARSSASAVELQQKFDHWTGPELTPSPPQLARADILGYGPLADELERGQLALIWAQAYVFADHPDKPFDGQAGGELMETSVAYNVFQELRKAKQELVIASPYMVPGKMGMALFTELRERDVQIIAMTNSLGSTDEPLVHIGYTTYRDQMLALGVEIYEVSGTRVKRNRRENLFGASLGRLHAKLAVVDKQVLFVGSMNLDPRSATINTELGAIIKSPALANEMIRIIDIDRLQSAYRLRLNAERQTCEWIGYDGDQEMVLTEEPDSSFLQRFKLMLLRPFVPESWL